MGLIKLCISIIIIIYCAYAVNGFILWGNSFYDDPIEEIKDNKNKLSEFIFEEHDLCNKGVYKSVNDVLTCKKSKMNIVYNCTDVCTKKINILE